MRNRRIAVVASLVAGCAPAFDDTRTESDPGSFGEHVVTLLCKRLAFNADPTDVSGSTYAATCNGGALPDNPDPSVAALQADRARTVAAIDNAVPPTATDALQAYLTSDAVLALYDDGTLATSLRSLGDLLDQLGSDADGMGAIARIGSRDGYRRPDVAIGQLGPMLSSVDVPKLLDTLLPAIDAGGTAKPQWDQVIAAAAATLSASTPQDDVPNSTATIVNALLLTEHPELAEPTPLPIVVRDNTGTAVQVTATTATPFATTGDTATRDPNGLAISDSGAPLYAYKDVTRTLIGALGPDTHKLLDPAKSTALDLVRGLSLMLGDRAPQTRTYDDGSTITYPGYDVAHSPALDLLYAFSQLLRDPNIGDTLALADQLFATAHQPALARVTEAAITTARLGDTFPDAEILRDAPLWDDLRPLLLQIVSDPKLVNDLLVALQKPEVALLADRFKEQMTYSDRFDIDPSSQAVTGSFATKPDRTQSDSGFNRSVFQRLLMVISDSNGASQCNKQGAVVKQNGLTLATYNACQLFSVNNLAVFYLQSIVYNKDASGNVICESNAGVYGSTKTATTGAGCAAFGAGWRPQPKANFNYNWGTVVGATLPLLGGDAFIESQSTITGFRTHPTPEALNRVLFLDPTPQTIADTADPMRDKDGDLFKVQHAGTLPVWEKNDFYTEIRPIMQAFADAGQEKTFVDILSVLHKHWSTKDSTTTQHTDPTAANYTYGSRGETYEPYIVAILGGDLWGALTQTSAELTAITANGKPFATIAANAGKYLTSPLAGLTDRLGGTTSMTSDGRPVTQLTPWQLLADAEDAKKARLTGSTLWSDSTRELVDIMFRGDPTGGWHFTNAHTPTMTLALVAMVRGRLAAHPDRVAWLSKELPDRIQDFATHPLLAAATDLITALEGPPRQALEQLLFDLFDPAGTAYPTMRASTAELIQLGLDDADLVPLGRIVGKLLAGPYLPVQVGLLRRLHAADTDKTLNDIVARLFTAQEPGIPVISAISDGVGDVDRVVPGKLPVWGAADYASTFHTVAAFMKEEQRGLLRFIAIVKGR